MFGKLGLLPVAYYIHFKSEELYVPESNTTTIIAIMEYAVESIC